MTYLDQLCNKLQDEITHNAPTKATMEEALAYLRLVDRIAGIIGGTQHPQGGNSTRPGA